VLHNLNLCYASCSSSEYFVTCYILDIGQCPSYKCCIVIGVLSDSQWIRIKRYHLWLILKVPCWNPHWDTACLYRGLSLVSLFFQANATRASQLDHDHFLPNISNLFTSHLISFIYLIVYSWFLYHHWVSPFTWRLVLGWMMNSELEVFVCRFCTIGSIRMQNLYNFKSSPQPKERHGIWHNPESALLRH
jgi:hypothetical protein